MIPFFQRDSVVFFVAEGMARCPCALGLEWERLQFLSILASDERSCLKIPR